ncbi:MAG: hypothetical protein OSW71_13310 [Proteobacteria bacterium]|nr:hypothetical protein [Pseudomonadota bacterium]
MSKNNAFPHTAAKWLKTWEQTFANPEAVGMVLSESVAQGDWRLFFLARDRVRDAKLADVQRVATQRLLADNRTVATYVPTDKPVRAPAPQRIDVAEVMKGFQPAAAAMRVEAFAATPANIDARTQRFEVGGLRAAVLPKGTRGQAVRAVLTLRFGDETSLAGLGEVPGCSTRAPRRSPASRCRTGSTSSRPRWPSVPRRGASTCRSRRAANTWLRRSRWRGTCCAGPPFRRRPSTRSAARRSRRSNPSARSPMRWPRTRSVASATPIRAATCAMCAASTRWWRM